MPFDNTARDKPAKGYVDYAVRYAARSFVSQMALATAFVPGMVAWFVVPAFPLRYAVHPGFAALIVKCQPLFVVLSVISVGIWWLLKRQDRDVGLAVLWALEIALVVLQVLGVYPGGDR